MPSIPLNWTPLTGRRASRVAKLYGCDEYILIHEERIPPNYGRADEPDNGSLRIHYDAVEQVFYRERAFHTKPSVWQTAPLPSNPDEHDDEEDA